MLPSLKLTAGTTLHCYVRMLLPRLHPRPCHPASAFSSAALGTPHMSACPCSLYSVLARERCDLGIKLKLIGEKGPETCVVVLSRSSYTVSLCFSFSTFFCFSLVHTLLITSFNDRLCCLGLLHVNSSGVTVAYLHTFSLPCFPPACFFQCVSSFSLGSSLFPPRSPCVSGARRIDVEQKPPSALRPPRCFYSSWPSIWPSPRSQDRVSLLCICCQAHYLLLTARAAFHGLVRTKRRRRRKKLRRLRPAL